MSRFKLPKVARNDRSQAIGNALAAEALAQSIAIATAQTAVSGLTRPTEGPSTRDDKNLPPPGTTGEGVNTTTNGRKC